MSEKQITTQQLRTMVKEGVRKALAERKKKAALRESKLAPKPAKKPAVKKLTAEQLREMVRDSILDVLEERVDRKLSKAAPKK